VVGAQFSATFVVHFPQNELSDVIAQFGNAAPSGLFSMPGVAQHSVPPSVDPAQSDGVVQLIVSLAVHVA
jgi:hypothetical protein